MSYVEMLERDLAKARMEYEEMKDCPACNREGRVEDAKDTLNMAIRDLDIVEKGRG